MEIRAEQVKELREKTGLGLMDCKKALLENQGDLEKAVRYLKEKGFIKALKRGSRLAREGVVAIVGSDRYKLIMELNCETDFVARTEDFTSASEKIATDLLSLTPFPSDKSEFSSAVKEKLDELSLRLGEKVALGRVEKILGSDKEYLADYLHHNRSMGVILKLQLEKTETSNIETSNKEEFQKVARELAMHIAALNPVALSREDLAKELLEEQKSLFEKQAKESNKPANIIEKIVEGRLKQFIRENVFLEQVFFKEGKQSIQELLNALGKQWNDSIRPIQMIRLKVGDE